MSRIPSEPTSAERQDIASSPVPLRNAKNKLTNQGYHLPRGILLSHKLFWRKSYR
jgi:hypothetical protein